MAGRRMSGPWSVEALPRRQTLTVRDIREVDTRIAAEVSSLASPPWSSGRSVAPPCVCRLGVEHVAPGSGAFDRLPDHERCPQMPCSELTLCWQQNGQL